MALKTLSSPLLSTSFHPSLSPQRFTHNARKFTCFSNSSLTSNSGQRNEEIVIVGAGIAGLATALALHRLGIQTLVLEQTDGLRTGGTSLTLFKNGWSVLDVLGVGDQLRSQFLQIQGLTLKSDEGKELRSFDFKDVDQSQEVRAVERRVLLQTLASELPSGSVQFSSKLAKIEEDKKTGETKLELTNGAILSAKVWKNYVCEAKYVNKNEICTTTGRLTPTLYSPMNSAENVAFGLYHYTPFWWTFRTARLCAVPSATSVQIGGSCRILKIPDLGNYNQWWSVTV